MWSGLANPQLVAEMSGHAAVSASTRGYELTEEQVEGSTEPRTALAALDAGCGEGADGVWLARRGWSVTGVDISCIALKPANEHV